MSSCFDRFNRLLGILQKDQSNIKIAFKDESVFMKLLGKLAFFNKLFMTNFTTVVGKTIYFPNRSILENSKDLGPLVILAHEYRHMYDFGGWLKSMFIRIAYFSPQILAPLMVLFLLLPIIWAVSISISIFLFLAFLCPLPSPGRKYYEVNGYITSLFVMNEFYKENGWNEMERKFFLDGHTNFINEQFTGPNYYYMWPWGVKSELNIAIDKILKEELEKEDNFYLEMKEIIKNSK